MVLLSSLSLLLFICVSVHYCSGHDITLCAACIYIAAFFVLCYINIPVALLKFHFQFLD